ncbi:MAG TPA: DUF3857 domain-containing protein [Candidatus Saccharimonadales bacterium]|nr:DUF3857 domain-containing protein [Candidatus Saccharimonadales bacterium]
MRSWPLLIAASLLVPSQAFGESLGIGPGPETITPADEVAAPGSPSGGPGAVILAEETEVVDGVTVVAGRSPAPGGLTTYHLRARILTNEGRGLADIQIPLDSEETRLNRWWGFTIRPDGTVLRIEKGDLREQTVVKVEDKTELRVMTALLPGVEPGTVIDYGYAVAGRPLHGLQRIKVQRRWPVRSLVYRWRPLLFLGAIGLTGICSISNPAGLDLNLDQEERGFVLRGTEIPPVVVEPWMPLGEDPGAVLTLYYTRLASSSGYFWNGIAKQQAELERRTLTPGRVRKAMEEMGLDPRAKGAQVVRGAYDWITANMENTGLRTAEDLEEIASGKRENESGRRIPAIVKSRKGTAEELDLLLLGIAHAAGVEARLVLTSDRRKNAWDPGLLAFGQFDESLVALRMPGEPAAQYTLADPGSGLAFGEIPWWISGGEGLMVEGEKAKIIRLGGVGASSNVSETRVTMRIAAEPEEPASVSWTRTGKGQWGLAEGRALVRSRPDDRKDRLIDMCRSGSTAEVVEADASGLERTAAGWSLLCRAESGEAVRESRPGEMDVSFEGPWIEPVPNLAAAPRVHPIEFPFAETVLGTIEIVPPPGFQPGPAPPPVEVDGPIGAYRLLIEARDGKWILHRSLRLAYTELPADRAPGLRKFFGAVRTGDRTLLTFRRTEPPS